MVEAKTGFWAFMKYVWRNAGVFRVYRSRDRLRVALCRANGKIAKLDALDPLTQQRIRELDEAGIYHYQGKWLATCGLRTGRREYFRRALAAFARGRDIADALLRRLEDFSSKPVVTAFTQLESRDTEIDWADDTPLVPEITPIVVLRGSDTEMGRQYARQIAEIFGDWILKHGHHELTDSEKIVLRRWEAEHAQYAPELLDFAIYLSRGLKPCSVAFIHPP